MLVGDWLDTLLNITAFVFIGFMIWLMVRPLAPPEADESDDTPFDET